MKPRIGITPSPSRDALPHGTFLRYAMATPYVDAVLVAGGIPIVLPPQDGHADALLDAVDGLLLSGGGDVEPARYGASAVHPTTYGLSPERDRFEIELFNRALERDVPVLGICRGLQVINVALGGTLLQDIASEYDGELRLAHRQQEIGLPADEPGHVVHLAPGTPLSKRLGDSSLSVNSFHHQAIATLAPGLATVAHSPDGLIEAVVMRVRQFVLAVQWHPELMFAQYREHLVPFQALVEAASQG